MTVDLFSDTQTRPTAGMREAMARAEVGDEQSGSDPTTNALCARVADLLGMEDGVFMPSGTMCNLAAILVQTRAGDEIIVDDQSHIYNTEAAGAAAIGASRCGRFPRATASTRRSRPRARSASSSARRPARPDLDRADHELLRRLDLGPRGDAGDPRHRPRARPPGPYRRGTPPQRGRRHRHPGAPLRGGFNSAWIDLSKGLGCPVGAVLCGTRAFVAEAWRWKYRLGGAMRQSGVLAAAGLYALDHHIDQLAEDNANAGRLGAALAGVPGLAFEPGAGQSNILSFSVAGLGVPAAAFAEACLAQAFACGRSGPSRSARRPISTWTAPASRARPP